MPWFPYTMSFRQGLSHNNLARFWPFRTKIEVRQESCVFRYVTDEQAKFSYAYQKASSSVLAEVNQLAEFACGWKVEQGPRNKVLAVELWFRSKDQAERTATERELDDTRDGRKARREHQGAPSRLQPSLVKALDALREGQPPPDAKPGRDNAADSALAELARQRAALVPDDE